jgi:N,N'-diacetyllegionaminate synthase
VSVRIGDFELGEAPLVVAELGNNHEGDPAVAAELIRAAAEAGAHAVKLQTFHVADFVRPQDERRFRQLERFELEPRAVEALAALARALGVLFVSTPLDFGSVDLLEPLVDAFKVASGDNDFLPLLDRVADSDRPLIVSTGLLDLDGVREVQDRIEGRRTRRGAAAGLAVLHTVTAYPSPPEQVNLAAIPVLARELGCPVGYSDHTLGIEACVLAAALGASILEKHLTLSHDFSDFRDHKLSAEPGEMRELVAAVARARVLTGRPAKELQPAEAELLASVRRSIVAARDLPAGTVLSAEDLTWMRPRDGLRPGDEAVLLGRRLVRPVAKGEAIQEEHVE